MSMAASPKPFTGKHMLASLLAFFGVIIAVEGCYYGFQTTGGAEGVGVATTKAVVASCVLILVADYFLAEVIFRIIFAPS
mgnify:CR=1 FL=1